MSIKKFAVEDMTGMVGNYVWIRRIDNEGFIMENSDAGGNVPGMFYSEELVTDKKLPMVENPLLEGVYEVWEERVPWEDGRYIARYCQADGLIIAIEEFICENDTFVNFPSNKEIRDNLEESGSLMDHIWETVDAMSVGTGLVEHVYTLTYDDDTPCADALVIMSTDPERHNMIHSGRTNALGQITFHVNLPVGTTVYLWRFKTGYNFVNPDVEEI